MSDTESFEQLMKIARYVLCNECGMLDNFGSLCLVHDNDCNDCQKSIVARIKAAHDREIRDTAQQAYHRGFEAGRHSMDAEHRAVAMRLRQLPLDGDDTYENLLSIGQAIWHDDFGCTLDGGSKLRDELVRLMGGVSDENVHVGGLRCNDGCMGDISNGEDTGRAHDSPSTLDRNHMAVRECVDTVIGDSDDTCDSQCCGACAAGDCDCAGEQTEVSDDGVDGGTLDPDGRCHAIGRDIHELGVTDERLADDCGADTDCGDGGGGVHMAGVSTYDVLWNERRKAIAELRKMTIDSDYYGNYQRIALAIGTVYDGKSFASECVRDRLIHLLGGDQPSGIDVLREMDAESDTDGTSPNDVRTSSITDELRKFTLSQAMTQRVTPDEQRAARKELQTIADRIDAQFDRICAQQEAVLQSTIDGMVKEYEHDRLHDQLRIEKLEKQRDHWHQEATDLMNRADAMEHERDGLLDLLEDAAKEYMNAQALCDELRYQREELIRKWMRERAERKELQGRLERVCKEIEDIQHERNELQAKLDRANGENKGLRLSIIEQKEAIIQRKKTIKKLTRDNEKVWKTVHELQERLDEHDRMHVELPKDANGKVFRIGCTVRMVERHQEVLTVHSITLCDDGEWLLYAVSDKDGYSCSLSTSKFEVCEPKSDTAESIVRDLSMGIITELQAIERIEALDD